MEVQITVEGEYGIESLEQWLRRDPDSARLPLERTTSPQQADRMGTFDVITTLVDNAVGVGALLVAAAAWVRPRGAGRPVVRIVRNNAVIVENASPEEARRILDSLERTNAPEGGGRS